MATMTAPLEDLFSAFAKIEGEPVENSATRTRRHIMPFGAEVQPNGQVRFQLFGPGVDAVQLVLTDRKLSIPMERTDDGWHCLVTDEAGPGSRYLFALPNGLQVPDPASRYQPDDVHGPSEVVAPGAYLWHDGAWTGRAWTETVLYELHIGTFTPEGTFAAAAEKLDHLRSLGVTALEIMPVDEFPGKRNWGYDGALMFAPDATYGRPEDFKAFVEAAHARGISVLLDVVYNHFGPDGNYIQQYFPDLQTSRHKTNWGDAMNYDGPNSRATREFMIHNALYWLEEFHLDGLRLDAVHAIIDESKPHLLEELADRVRAAVMDRPLHLILENERNQACRLERNAQREPVHYNAQWNDDIHHVLHTAGTHEDGGYYKNYEGEPNLLGRALAQGFAYQGQCTPDGGKKEGHPCSHLPPTAFVSFIQNHDQIGNRAMGERINAIVEPHVVRALAAVYLLLPQVPMLFMGEEWCATAPFPYFADFAGDLGEKVREGRRNEFKLFPEFSDPAQLAKIPDPMADETFQSAKLDWAQLKQKQHSEWLAWYREAIAKRHERIVPLLERINAGAGSYEVKGSAAVCVRWKLDGGGCLQLSLNLCENPQDGFTELHAGEDLWHTGPEPQGTTLGAWSVRWSLI